MFKIILLKKNFVFFNFDLVRRLQPCSPLKLIPGLTMLYQLPMLLS